ncbi:methyltransferase domain-containing protein [Candidatus Palauibacter sp.]|uniref:sterol methyltransferase family protein n=1 Tax=Candidatus Palauibacter sp. TaxID=3101350 RepID=UPI003B02BE99
MTPRMSGFLRGAIDDGDVASAIREYEDRYGGQDPEAQERRKSEYRNFAKLYFDLVTDFYEYGWDRSFHFAPRARNEGFAASLARHEHRLAYKIGLGPGMVALDLGCGIGGPLRRMVRFSGARIVGVSISGYQIARARTLTEAADLGPLADYVECDFMEMDFPDESFDAAFAIETTCCAPDKFAAFGETFRVLKPGARLGVYEYCLTDRFDPQDPEHLRLKADLELGGGLPDIAYPHEVDHALREAGFELLEAKDVAVEDPSCIPWYEPLSGSGLSLANFRSSRAGRVVTHCLVWTLERLGIIPRGALRVSGLLNMAAAAFARAGQLGIFTPMYFVLARKPDSSPMRGGS